MSTNYVSINNELYAETEAKISVSDLSIQRGFGIFDFLKTVKGKAIFIEDHLDRFYNSAKEMNLIVKYNRTELLKNINEMMEANNLPNSGIKFILTGGYSADGYTLAEPNLIITQTPFNFELHSENDGLKLVTYNHQRQLPTVKTIDYLQAIRLQPYIKENKAHDVLYNNNGLVTECPRANFFIVTDHEIITAKSNILKGITRSKILNMNISGYTILEKDFNLNDIYNAKEAFISSSTKNAFPVTEVDGKQIGTGKAGNIVAQINTELYKLIGLSN